MFIELDFTLGNRFVKGLQVQPMKPESRHLQDDHTRPFCNAHEVDITPLYLSAGSCKTIDCNAPRADKRSVPPHSQVAEEPIGAGVFPLHRPTPREQASRVRSLLHNERTSARFSRMVYFAHFT